MGGVSTWGTPFFKPSYHFFFPLVASLHIEIHFESNLTTMANTLSEGYKHVNK